MPVGAIVCHGRLIDILTLNFIHFGRYLVDAGDIKTSFNGINLYSKNHREGFYAAA